MAMTPLTWNTVTIAAPTLLNWPPDTYPAPAAIIAAINGPSSLTVFCISDDGTSATIAFDGGVTLIPSAAVTVSAVLSLNTQVMNDGETWYSIRGSTTQWYFYGDQAGVVRALTNSTTLGAFIS